MLILCCCISFILGHDFNEEEKLGKIAVNLITISFRDNPSLAKYRTVWATLCCRYLLLDTFSLACKIQIVSAYISIAAAGFFANRLNSLIVE